MGELLGVDLSYSDDIFIYRPLSTLCPWAVGGGPPSLLPCLPPLTTQGGHPLPGGGGLCAWCAVLNFPAGINQGLDSLPPPTASALLQPPLVKTIPAVTAMGRGEDENPRGGPGRGGAKKRVNQLI